MEEWGAKVSHVYEDIGHEIGRDSPGKVNHYLYSNLEGSGVSAMDSLKRPNFNWQSDGYLLRFDQRPFIQSALEKFVQKGGDRAVDHHLLDYGYFYYPKGCVVGGTKCKFQLVSHGAGGWQDGFPNAFGPWGSAYDMVMVWPACKSGGWDDQGYTGSLHDTKYSIQSLFVQELIAAVSKPLDSSFDYKVESSGGDTVTVTEAERFLAGMVNELLDLHDLDQLKSCING